MFFGKLLYLALYLLVIGLIFDITLSKIKTNKIEFLTYDYPSYVQKNESLNTTLEEIKETNTSFYIPENIIIKIGILANPEPINNIYDFSINSTNTDEKNKKAVFNSTYINWMNSTINYDFILVHIENYFKFNNFLNKQNGLKHLILKIEFVPLLFWQNDTIIDEIFQKINGVLFIGGDRNVDFNYEWENYAIKIVKKIMKLQENKRKIPLWGICQGIEIINAILVNSTNILEKFEAWNIMHNLEIRQFENSKNKNLSIYNYLNENEINFLNEEKSTVHFHNLGISPKSFNKKEYSILKKMFQISAFGYDENGKRFINSIESYQPYNIFAVQYHPEKNPIKKMKNLRKSIEEYMSKFKKINAKISINYFIKAIEDYLIINNNSKNHLEFTSKINKDKELIKENSKNNIVERNYVEEIKLSNRDIVYNFKGSILPVYIFSE